MEKTIYSDEYCKLLLWLKAERASKRLTMRQLGKRLGVHHSVIGRIELGERRLDILEFVHYCNALEVDPKEGIMILQETL